MRFCRRLKHDWYTLFFLSGQFYKDNEPQICLRIKDNLRTIPGSFLATIFLDKNIENFLKNLFIFVYSFKSAFFPLHLYTKYTIKGGSRRAEKSRKMLMMMMKAAKLGWAGPAGQEQD